jgi:hypothetical protein
MDSQIKLEHQQREFLQNPSLPECEDQKAYSDHSIPEENPASRLTQHWNATGTDLDQDSEKQLIDVHEGESTFVTSKSPLLDVEKRHHQRDADRPQRLAENGDLAGDIQFPLGQWHAPNN